MILKHQPLQSLEDAPARHDLPTMDMYPMLMSTLKEAFHMIAGMDRVSSGTTDNLVSPAISTSDYDGVLETIRKHRTLDRAEIW
jgi:hypothetical protein